MKKLIFLILIIFSLQSFSQRVFENKYIVIHRSWGDYVINAKGGKVSISDTINGIAVPMTYGDTVIYCTSVTGLTPISTFTRTPGTEAVFALNRNTEFSGSITVSDDSLKFCSYGTSGAKPIITGFTTVTGWTQINDTIWESTNAVSSRSSTKLVKIDGVNTPMGREPELGSYYTVSSHVNDTSITSTEIFGATDWTGANVIIRKERWIWQDGFIDSHVDSTIFYTDIYTGEPQNWEPQDGWAFFIQNDSNTLDTQNEWYFNPVTKKLRIYSTTEPTDVQVSSQLYNLTATNKENITIRNIDFEGSDSISIYAFGGDNWVIQNCELNNNGFYGIRTNYVDSLTIDNNTISNTNYIAISNANIVKNTITNNTIDSTAMIIGIGGQYASNAVVSSGDTALVQYNTITNSGYQAISISVSPGKSEIKNNFINNSVLNRSDGGGIYTAGTHVDLTIEGNIVLNTVGYTEGTNGGGTSTKGIYLDEPTLNAVVLRNTSAYNGEDGFFLHNGCINNELKYNTSFDNDYSQMSFDNYGAIRAYDNDFIDNIFVAKDSSQLVWDFNCLSDSIPQWVGVSDSNYLSRPVDLDNYIRTNQPSETSTATLKNLTEWQTFATQDANSIDSVAGNRFYMQSSEITMQYNNTKLPVTIALSTPKIDIEGNEYASEITLQPYTSIILFEDYNYDRIGITGIGTSAYSTGTNTVRAYAVTPAENISIEYMIPYVSNLTGGGTFIAGIYADDGSDSPGTLIASTVETVTGWSYDNIAVFTTPVALVSGTKYWFAYIFSASNSARFETGYSNRRASGTHTWDGTLPTTFPTPSYSAAVGYCISAIGK